MTAVGAGAAVRELVAVGESAEEQAARIATPTMMAVAERIRITSG